MITHLLRTVPSEVLGSRVADFSFIVRSTLDQLLGCAVTDQQWFEACSPITNGGLWLSDPTAIVDGAYIASALGALKFWNSYGVTLHKLPELGDALTRVGTLLGPTSGWLLLIPPDASKHGQMSVIRNGNSQAL